MRLIARSEQLAQRREGSKSSIMHWMTLCPSCVVSTEQVQKECAGCRAKVVSFVPRIALVCNGWKPCSMSWTSLQRTFLLFSCTFLGTLIMRPTLGVGEGRGLVGCSFAPPFQVHGGPFFCHVFAVVCATSKKVQATRGARVSTVQGLMNVMCTQLLHTMRHVIPMGWEESLGVEVGSSPIKGRHIKFLRTRI